MNDAAIDLLVLEDNPGDLRLLEAQLAGVAAPRFRIASAERLSDALRLLGERRFDAVLCDLNVPDSEGLDTANAIRRHARGTAVVVLSGSGDDALALEAVHAGAQDYLVKGDSTPGGIARAIRHAIERKQLELRLHDAVSTLERRVRERTAELEQYNTKLSEEIAERRSAELRARQLGALYAILGDVNQAIAQSGSEEELFRRTCRAIHAHEDYVAAGFGIVDAERAAIVPGVVSEGFESVAQRLHLRLDASVPEGQSPSSIAVREERAVFIGDLQRQWGETSVWSALAKQYRVRSLAALPLRRGGHICAVFSIYSGKPEFFGPEERALAQRLAENLSYALDHFDRLAQRDHAEAEVKRHVQSLRTAMLGTVGAVSAIVEQRDPYTSGHQRRVGELAAAIGAELQLPPEHCDGLRIMGAVHDVGKIGVPAEILSKPGRLSVIEFELVKRHSEIGFEILRDVEFPWPVAEAVRQHHERLDGSGYPRGLKGADIIVEARILAIADVVESIGSHRPYRPMLGIEVALDEIEAHAGTKYCEQGALACLRLFRERGYQIPD